MAHWTAKLRDLVARCTDRTRYPYLYANSKAVETALAGAGPHGGAVDPNRGKKAVVNLAARHALSFLDTRSGKPGRGTYLNRGAVARIFGKALTAPTIRDRVDAVLEAVATERGQTLKAPDMHFAALELNGTGIAYFGDVCLVLRDATVPDTTLVLDRNSYDMTVSPVVEDIYFPSSWGRTHKNAVDEVRNWAGQWDPDAEGMARVKVLAGEKDRDRRLTTGQISDRILSDEDYIEIILGQPFTPAEVQEIRLAAPDIAREAQIGDRIARGPAPSASEFLWRARRKAVWRDAARAGVPCRVVTSTGRGRD